MRPILAPGRLTARHQLRRGASASQADQVLQITSRPVVRWLPSAAKVRSGAELRELAVPGMPPLDAWDLTMGGVELS